MSREQQQTTTNIRKRLAKNLLLFTLLRIVLILIGVFVIGIICNILNLTLPGYLYFVFAILYALPLSMLFDSKLNITISKDFAILKQQRRARRAALLDMTKDTSELKGEEPKLNE